MRFEIDKLGCWNFTGSIADTGYGRIRFKKIDIPAHRLMAHITHKPLMSPLEVVAHRCDNKRCINPHHLFITTNAGNIKDRDQKGRTAKGVRAGLTKLTEKEVLTIRGLYADGLTLSKIAARFPKIGSGCVQAIVSRRTWKHI